MKKTKFLAISLLLGIVLLSGCAQEKVESTGEVKEFTLTAKQFEFFPSTITVNQGDTVKLTIESIDVTHGFYLSEFGINKKLEPGKKVDIEFVADKRGSFKFACSVFCGSGHGTMSGTLIVK